MARLQGDFRLKYSPMLLLCAVAIIGGRLCMSGTPAGAAEVGCATFGYDGHSIPEPIARKLWPSGFRPVAGMCSRGFLNGEIMRGDFDKVTNFYRRNHPLVNSFDLVSIGGDVDDAIKIGRLFRRYLIYTSAPGGRHFYGMPAIGTPGEPFFCKGTECICASACALVWLGGVHRSGEVGLHRPRTDDPEFKTLPPDTAIAIYRRSLDEIQAYLKAMEVPAPIIDEMVATGSSEIRWVEVEPDDDNGNLARPPSFAEWEDATCGPFTLQEVHTITNLRTKETGPAPAFTTNEALLTPDEAMLLRLLEEKQSKYLRCQLELRDSRVAQLAPP